MKYFKIVLMLILPIILFLTSLSVFAGVTGKIFGRITDAETGEPIIGANVVLVDTYLGAATDGEGSFIILQIPPGKYEIEVSFMGYHTQRIKNISVNIDLTTKLSFQLKSKLLELDAVIIVAEKEMIARDMTATQSTVDEAEIEALPVQEISDVLKLQAGVVQGRDGGLHIRGGRTEEVSYLIDGVAVTDVFSGNLSVEVENSSVQELQVISGTFNAEYGRAMSGIVNIVTKEGGKEYKGSASVYWGDYLSSANEIFPHIDEFDPLGVINSQVTLHGPVPFTNRKLRFFLNARYLNDDGYIMGTNIFNPTDSSNFSADNQDNWYIEKTGDGKAVPMNPKEKKTLHGKLSYRFSPQVRLSTSLMVSDLETRDWRQEGKEFVPENQFHDYYHFLLNPDGAAKQYQKSYTWLSILDHNINATTFYTLTLSAINNEEKSYVYEDPFDERYLHQRRLENISYGNAFYTGGVDLWHSERTTKIYGAKIDITSQVNMRHQLKSGLEARSHELSFEEFKIIPAKDNNGIELKPFVPALPPPESPFNNRYSHSPKEFAFYFQDKMEFDFMIVNAGLRYDYFDPNAPIPTDLGDPGNPDKLKKADIKHQVSPRLGLAYPIFNSGALHFSYGYFFQIPLFQYLYANSEFEVEIGRLKTLMGNADLKPQKTIIYELGYQQEITSQIAMDFTIYYKDIRDLLGTEIHELTCGADRYARYVNRDFGNTRGFVFALNQRSGDWFSSSLDYTFQIAEANASEPNASFIDRQSNRESEKHLVPADWDQRHTINGTIMLNPLSNLSVTLLGKYGSGMPYTPVFLSVKRAYENTGRSKATLTFDLKTQYTIKAGIFDLLFFLKALNLLDARNEIIVYNDTGRSGFTLGTQLTGTVRGVNTVDDFFNNPPHHFSPPRQVLFGMTVAF